MTERTGVSTEALAFDLARARVLNDVPRVSKLLGRFLADLSGNVLSPDLELRTQATCCGCPTRTIRRHFRTSLNMSFSAYVRSVRLEVAQHLLQNNCSVWEVAKVVGYSSASSFTRAYVRRHGRKPTSERRAPFVDDHVPAEDRFSEIYEIFLDHLWPRLLEMERSQRAELFIKGYRFHPLAIAEELKRLSREDTRDDRRRGVRLAELAVYAVYSGFPEMTAEERLSHEVEALANLANARRMASDPMGAESEFKRIDALLATGEVPAAVEGYVKLVKGHLRSFQRRLDEALDLLTRAAEIWRAIEDDSHLIKTLLALGQCQELRGEVNTIVCHYEEAARLAGRDEFQDDYLKIAIYWHLANGYRLVGQREEARETLGTAIALLSRFEGSSVRAHLRWLEGLVDLDEGEMASAKRAFYDAKKGLEIVGEAANAAVVSLDLAVVELKQGGVGSATRLVAEALPVLHSVQLEGEIVVSLKVLEESLVKERVAGEVLLDVRRLLSEELSVPRLVAGSIPDLMN